MSADPSEGRERARQEFEKWMAEWGPAFSLEKWPNDAQLGTYRGMDTEDCWHAFQAGRRSLEQERAAILKLVECAFDMLPSNVAGACYELRRAIRELRAVPKGDS